MSIRSILTLSAMLGLVACDGSRGHIRFELIEASDAGSDGSANADGGNIADGGSIDDGGASTDGAANADGEVAADGGANNDGGNLDDGGANTDGGGLDGGAGIDGGNLDGGTSMDGGGMDGAIGVDGGVRVDGGAGTDGGGGGMDATIGADGGAGSDGGRLDSGVRPDAADECDRDEDTFRSIDCGGLDCDDDNPYVFPNAVELCDDFVDNDCNGDIDTSDLDCQVINTTCEYAYTVPLTEVGTDLRARLLPDGEEAGCGKRNFFQLVIERTSTIALTITIERPTVGVEDIAYQFNAFLETECGNFATNLFDTPLTCSTWDPADGPTSGGTQTVTFTATNVPMGYYVVEVNGKRTSGDVNTVEYRLQAVITPE